MKKVRVASALIAVTAFGCGGGDGGMSRGEIIDQIAKESGIPKDQATCIVDELDGKVDLEKIAKAQNSSDVNEKDTQAFIDATVKCIDMGVPTTGG